MKDLSTICGNCEKDEGLHSAFGLNCPLPNGEGFNSQSTFESKREPCPATPGWIAVSERLPEYGQLVLMWFVTVNPANSGPTMGSRTIHEEGKYWDVAGIYRDFSAISHWQPLPVPPLAAPPAPHKEENGNSKL